MKNTNNKVRFIFLILSVFFILSVTFVCPGCIGSKPPRYIPEETSTTIVKEELIFGSDEDEQLYSEKTISVSSTGTIKTSPDEVSFYIVISTEKPSSEEALSENSAVSENVLTAVKGFGENNVKIETSGYNLYPLYNYSEDNPPVIYAYTATTSYIVKTQMIDKTGEIITGAVEAGATQINDIIYDLSDETRSSVKEAALKEAVKDANRKAKAIADEIAAEIKEIISVKETNIYYSEPVSASRIKGEGGDDLNLSPIILPRELEVTAEIIVVFSYK